MASNILRKVIQFLFFLFNFIFFCLGIAVLGVGIYSRVENDNWEDLLDSPSMYEAANILIAAGIIVAIIGFFGCYGAFKRHSCMLVFYAVFVLVIFILEIAAGIYAYTKQDTIEESLTTKLSKGVTENYGKDDTASKGLTLAIDWFQVNVKCCGGRDVKDWRTSFWFTSKNTKNSSTEFVVPKTCCKTQTNNCNVVKSSDNGTTWSSTTIFGEGCVPAGITFAQNNMLLIGGVGVGIAVVQLLGILFSLKLRSSFKGEDPQRNIKV